MNIGEILIWESTNALLLIPLVIGLVMLTRWIRGRPVFTERDWLFLTGRPWEKLSRFTSGSRCRFSHRAGSLACCAEVVAVNLLWVRPDSSVDQFNPAGFLQCFGTEM
jgi:hypothetical protein